MESFNLNIIPGKDRPVCHASQYDIGRTIRVNLFEGFNVFTLDGTEVISISVRKPDGNVVTESVTNTSDNYVEFVTTEQMTACHGSNLCELKLEKGADVIGTMNFILEVEQDPLEGGVQSASEIDNLQTQIAGMVATEVANQYDSANVIFDATPTAGHGVGYAVTSEGVAAELALKQDATDNSLATTDKTIVGAINEHHAVIGYSYDAYDATTAYSKDDLCIYNNTLYKAKQATTGNLPTNTTYWEPTSIADAKQDATDNSLSTTDKTIVGAINELVTYKASKSDVDNNQVSVTKINQSAFNLIATRRGHCVVLAFDGSLPAGTYGNIWQCSLKPTTSIRAVVAWGTSITLIDIDTDGIIGFRNAKTITESTYIGGELVFVTPS